MQIAKAVANSRLHAGAIGMTGMLRRVMFAIAGLSLFGGASVHAADLQKIHFGFSAKAITPVIIDMLIPEYLGYYKEEGLTFEALPLGSDGTLAAAINAKRLEFSTGNPAFQLAYLAKGEKVPNINFFESTYPFKYAMAVKPNSPIRGYDDLKGKRIGVSGFGNNDYPVSRTVLAAAGYDVDKDVTFLAVGDGAPAGVALERGDIDCLFSFDTAFGTLEAVGIQMRYLPLPAHIPKIGGLYLSAPPDILRDHRQWAIGFARGVAKAHIFIQQNPKAAAYIFGKMFPEALPKGKPLNEQINAILISVEKRMKLYKSYDPFITQFGYMRAGEWEDEVKFAGLDGKVKDPTSTYTNDLIPEINKFDPAKIEAEARDFKVPE